MWSVPCTSSDHLGPFNPFSKRHLSDGSFSSLACKSQVVYFTFVQSTRFHKGTLIQYFISSSFLAICGRYVIKRLLVPLMVIMIIPFRDGLFQLPWKVIVLQFHNVLHGPVISLYLNLGPGVIWRTTSVFHILIFEPALQWTTDIAWPGVR